VEDARSDANEGLLASVANQDPFYANCNRAVLGFLELSLSNPSGAMEHLRPVVEYLEAMEAAEPCVIPCVPDAVECLVAAGDLDAAERLVEDHERKGRDRGRPWAVATAERGRGLLLAARGDAAAGLEALERSVKVHRSVPQPFELGRTLLVRGEVARRAKQKALARESLEHAGAVFDGLGAPLWSAKAGVELARVGGPAGGGDLTPTERRIANLVVAGRTNREIADDLFISVKTVEANLTRVFLKMGVRSRAQLIGSMMAEAGSDPRGPDRQN
jgi:DNA-binding CsgD family transcriptional regulator